MAAHSILVGGSIAARRLNCPASFQESLKQPQSARGVSSVYADRGTALHTIMSELLTIARDEKMSGGLCSLTAHPRQFDDVTITAEDIAEAIVPPLDALDQLMLEHGGGFKIVAIEAHVRFPGLPAAFGTVDLILQSATHVLVVDYKFGQGVPVAAIYIDNENGD